MKNESYKLKIENDRLKRVLESIANGQDVGDWKSPDAKHVTEILAHIYLFQEVAPGFIDEFFPIMLPHFIKMHNKAAIGAMAQKKADEAGFGAEWRAAVDAANSPSQKDYLEKMVQMYMKANGVDQNQAIKAIAEQTGRGIDSIRRSITRSKARKK